MSVMNDMLLLDWLALPIHLDRRNILFLALSWVDKLNLAVSEGDSIASDVVIESYVLRGFYLVYT